MGMCMYLKVLSRSANFIFYKMPKIIKYHHKQNLDIQPTVRTICPFKGEKAENEAQCILGSLGGLLEIDLFKKKNLMVTCTSLHIYVTLLEAFLKKSESRLCFTSNL